MFLVARSLSQGDLVAGEGLRLGMTSGQTTSSRIRTGFFWHRKRLHHRWCHLIQEWIWSTTSMTISPSEIFLRGRMIVSILLKRCFQRLPRLPFFLAFNSAVQSTHCVATCSQTVYWGNDVDANGESPVFYEGELEGFSFIRYVFIYIFRVISSSTLPIPDP